MEWANDYGDIPGWYWRSTAFQLPRALEERRRQRRARTALATLAAVAAI